MSDTQSNPPTVQFSVRMKEDRLRDLRRMAAEEGMTVAAFIRWLALKEKERRTRSSSR